MLGAAKTIVSLSWISLFIGSLANAQCPVGSAIVKGHVEHPPHNAGVRVQLIYPKEQKGESAEMTLDGVRFSIPIEFLTESRRPVLLSNIRTKCDRRPTTVIVTLVEGDQQYDRVTLDFAKDFKTDISQVYSVRSEVVLNGQP